MPPPAPVPRDAVSTAVYCDYLEEYGDDPALLAYWRLVAGLRRELDPWIRILRQLDNPARRGREYLDIGDVRLSIGGTKRQIIVCVQVVDAWTHIWVRWPWLGYLEPDADNERYYRRQTHRLARSIFEAQRGEKFRKIADPED